MKQTWENYNTKMGVLFAALSEATKFDIMPNFKALIIKSDGHVIKQVAASNPDDDSAASYLEVEWTHSNCHPT